MADGASPARTCAFDVIRRVFEHGAYADRAFAAESAQLEPRDRALSMQLAYGTVQRRLTLDTLIERLSRRAAGRIDPPVLAAIRLGLFQLAYLDGIPEHAAVNESVELAKDASPRAAGMVNAVLRRAVAETPQFLAGLRDGTPDEAAVAHSVPPWLAEMWWRELGAARARALLESINRPAEASIRLNTLAGSESELATRVPVPAHPAPGLDEGLVLEAPFDVHGSALFADGIVMPQSRASMLVARILAPRPGQRVLDLCAAPGAKTTHLAALMRDQGELIAVERHPGRAAALRRTCERMHASCATVTVADATALGDVGVFERVLVDPPCSGLGTLQSRPDLRWRASAAGVLELAALQGKILERAARATAPGGALVYSVCTVSRAEGAALIDRFLARERDFTADDLGAEHPQWREPRFPRYLQLLPGRDGTDGFFIARLRRR